jgi:hypothetical protein
MPTPGLSLVGFMEPQQAINYQRMMCVPADPSDAALLAEWNTARGNLGAVVSDAGKPNIQEIPPGCQAYIQQLSQQPWVQQSLAPYPGAAFKVVEIDPLLAFQFHILTDHSDNHCGTLRLAPGIADLLPIFLPQAPPQEALRISLQSQSFVMAADSLNVRIMAQGLFQAENKVGIQFGIGLPFVHVARFNGRCYLMNGFHRALGARLRGAGLMPCLFREVANHIEVGIRDDGSTFSIALLESPNPPTLRHFTQNRAHTVAVRKVSRILQVNWSEHAVPLE